MGLTGSVRRVHIPLRDLSIYQGPEQRRASALLLCSPECVERLFENSWRASRAYVLVSQGGQMGLLHPLLATRGAPIWSLPSIFEQSRKRRSRQFALGICGWDHVAHKEFAHPRER